MAQYYHDKITELFDAYYVDKKTGGVGTPVKERIASSNALVEHYVDQYGKRPPNSVLSRLATYILLDTLTDPHPDKMSRDEYPIMSYGQTGRYFERNTSLAGVEYSREDVRGTVSNSATGARDVLLSPVNKDDQAVDWDVFLRQILNEREYVVIISLYKDGMTQAETAEKIGVDRTRISRITNIALDKLRLYIENT